MIWVQPKNGGRGLNFDGIASLFGKCFDEMMKAGPTANICFFLDVFCA